MATQGSSWFQDHLYWPTWAVPVDKGQSPWGELPKEMAAVAIILTVAVLQLTWQMEAFEASLVSKAFTDPRGGPLPS